MDKIKIICFIFACVFSLNTALYAQTFSKQEFFAQTFSGQEYWEMGRDAICDELNVLKKFNLVIGYQSYNQTLLIRYKLSRSSSIYKVSSVFDAINIESLKNRLIKRIISEAMKADLSGKKLEDLVYKFKIRIRVEVHYKKSMKLATATPEEFKQRATLLY